MSDARPRAIATWRSRWRSWRRSSVPLGPIAVAIALAFVVALTVAVMVHPGPLPGEVGWVNALQRLGSPAPELAELVRLTTGTEGALVVAVVPAVWAVARHGRRGALAAIVVAAAMLVVQPLLKDIVDRPRPDVTQVEVRAGSSSESFPSGHSLSTTAVWGTFAVVALGRRHPWLAALASVPIAANLVAGGVQGLHWPTDSIAGTLVGGMAALLAVRVLTPPAPADHR